MCNNQTLDYSEDIHILCSLDGMAPSPSKERKPVYEIGRLVYTTWQRNRIEHSELNEIDGISSPKRAFHRLCSSNRDSSHYSVTPKVLPNYRMANDLPNFGNRSTEKTLILPLLSPLFFSFPVSCLFYRDSTSLGLSSLEQWYFISTTIRMVLRHYLCHSTSRFIHEYTNRLCVFNVR